MGAGAVLAPYESAPVFDGLADDPEGDSFKADMLRWLAWTSFKEPARQRARFGGALGSRFARFSMNVKRKWGNGGNGAPHLPASLAAHAAQGGRIGCRPSPRLNRAARKPKPRHPALRWAEASAVRAFVICAALPRQCRGRVARRALFSLLQGRAAP